MKRVAIRLAAFAVPLMYSLPVWAEEAHEGAKKTLPQLDVALYPGVLFWMIASFVAFFLIMKFFGVPGVQETIAKRRHVLDTDLGAARKASEEAQLVVKAYEDGLLDARRKANETVGTIVAQAAQEAAEQYDKQNQDLHHRMDVARLNLAEAKKFAMTETQQFVNDLVQDIVNKVLQSGVDLKTSKAGK